MKLTPLHGAGVALAAALTLACSASPIGESTTPVSGAKGGGGTPAPSFPVLPTTAPAPGVLLRESFGLGDSILRPHGGKGALRSTYIHTSIGGFWAEWPGSKNTQWSTPNGDQTWKFCSSTDNWNEMPSPLQATQGNGCVASEWFDPVPYAPTAKVPFTPPATAYELTMNGYPAVVWPNYIAIGFTAAPDTISGLENKGALWMALRSTPTGGPLHYEVRLNGSTGALLASGDTDDMTWNQMALRYDPVTQQVSARLNDLTFGPFPARITTPRYVAFEGVGIMDNLVVWQR